jgi:hypothetical protein
MGAATSSLIGKLDQLAESAAKAAQRLLGYAPQLLAAFGTPLSQRITEIEGLFSKVGLSLSDSIANASDASQQKLSTLFSGIAPVANAALKGLIPGFSAIGDGLSAAFSKIPPSAIAAFDAIDAALLKTVTKIQSAATNIPNAFGAAANTTGYISGVREPLEVFNALSGVVSGVSGKIFSLTQQVGLFGLGLQQLQGLITSGPFSALIGQNIELQQQLLSTQASLVATNRIFNGDQLIKGSKEAILSLAVPVKQAIKQLEIGSRELSNVTSKDLVPIFSIVAGEAGRIGTSLKGATDLTLSFSAALGTLGIPLFQANQEIRSILNGQIDNNSRLAIQLQITSAMVQQWKAQGTLVQELTKRLEPLREGNKLAADQVGNLGSNIKDIFEIIQRTAGAPLLEPIVKQLREVYTFLDRNQASIGAFISSLLKYAVTAAGAIREAIGTIGTAIAPLARLVPTYLFESLANVAVGLASAIKTTIAVLQPFINIFTVLAQAAVAASGPILQLYLQFKVLEVTTRVLFGSFGLLANILPVVGEVLFLLGGRTQAVVGLFGSLTTELRGGTATALLLGKNLAILPGAMGALAKSIPLVGGALAPLIPQLATFGIGLVTLGQRFPIVQEILNKFSSQVPQIAQSLSTLAASNGLPKVAALFGELGAQANLAAFANTKMEVAITAASTAARAAVIRMGLFAAGITIAAVAINELIIKNQAAIDTLKSFGQFLSDVGSAIYIVLSQPLTYLAAAIAAVSYAITAQLLPSTAALKIAMLSGLGGAVTAVTAQMLKYAEVMKAIGFVQSAAGAQALAAQIQVVAAASAAGTLTVGGLTTSLGTMAVAAAVALAPLALIAGGLVLIAKTYQHTLGIVERGGSVVPSVVANIVDVIKGKLGPALSLLPPQIQAIIFALDKLKGIKIDGAIAPTIASANKALADSTGINDELKAAIERTNKAKEKGLALTEEELKLNNEVVKKAAGQLLILEGEISNARRDLNAAKDPETKKQLESKISQLEARRDTLLLADAEGNLARINRQLTFAKKDLNNIKGEDEKKLAEQQIVDLEKQKEKLEGVESKINLKPIILTDFGNTEKVLKDRVKAAQAILETPFDAKALKQAVGDLVDLTQQQLEIGTVNIEVAANRIKDALKIGQLEPEERAKLEKALTGIIKNEYELRASAFDALIATQQRKLKGGEVDEVEGEKEVTRLKTEQYKERLEGLDAQIRAELAMQKLRTGKSGEEDGNYSQAYKKLVIERQKVEEESNIFILEDTQKRLDKQLELIARQTSKLTDAITEAETQSNTEIQELLNKQSITQTQANELRERSTRERLQKELALEKTNLDELNRLEKPTDPAKRDEFERKVRASKIKTSQLTLQLAEEEQRRQSAVFASFSEKLERQTKAMSTAIGRQSNEYQKQITVLNQMSTILSNQNKLMEQRQSLAGAIAGYVESDLKLLAETSKSEEEKAYYEKAAAAERLQFLVQEQGFARAKLELSIQQKRIEDAQALRQNQIDQLSATSEAAQAQANLKKVEADPNALPEAIEAAKLDLQVKTQKILVEQDKGTLLGESVRINRQGEGFQRTELGLKQDTELRRAKLDFAKTLPGELGEGAVGRLRNEARFNVGFERPRDAIREAQDRIFADSPNEGRSLRRAEQSFNPPPAPDYSQTEVAANQLGVKGRNLFYGKPPDVDYSQTQSAANQLGIKGRDLFYGEIEKQFKGIQLSTGVTVPTDLRLNYLLEGSKDQVSELKALVKNAEKQIILSEKAAIHLQAIASRKPPAPKDAPKPKPEFVSFDGAPL